MVTPQVKRFTLGCAEGGRLPAWSGGSHIGVTLTDGDRTWRNSYSLIGVPGETQFYQIAVRREDSARSKGGSVFLHERVREGNTLEISAPHNYFPLARHAKKHVLIAGGIGITPFLAQMAALKAPGRRTNFITPSGSAVRARSGKKYTRSMARMFGFMCPQKELRLSPSAILARSRSAPMFTFAARTR